VRTCTLLTDGSQRQEDNVTPSHSVVPLLGVARAVESGARESDKRNTGHPDGPAKRQGENVSDEGQRWPSKHEGVPATCEEMEMENFHLHVCHLFVSGAQIYSSALRRLGIWHLYI
jgi:hypothetical protein